MKMFEFIDEQTINNLEAEHLPNLKNKKQWFADKITLFAEILDVSCEPGDAYVDASRGANQNSQTLEWLSNEYVKLDTFVRRLESKHGA